MLLTTFTNRPVLALMFFVIYLAVAFGLRTWRHRHSTGSTGFHGISGRPGSLPWLGGVLLGIALLLGGLAPTAELIGLVQPLIVPSSTQTICAVLTILLGTAATYWAQAAMGRSWRIGVKADERTEMVTDGPFRWVRNPIFSFMLLTSFGMAALLPNALSLASVVCLLVAVELQVRFVEEPYLQKMHGAHYAEYCMRTGRFVPGLGLRRFE